jgi:UDP-glucose 4-epimerase
MKHVLVTGGLGFVGSHLVDTLLGRGDRVTIVDSCISNVMQPEDYSNRCEVLTLPVEDIGNHLMPSPRRHYDEIYHLASVVGPAGVLRFAGDIARSTVASSDTVVQLALAHHARLILTSTSEVYGHWGTFSENDDMIVPARFTVRLEYAVAKLTTEISALNRAQVTDLHVNIVRPFNISGPRQLAEGGFVLPRFVISALRGEPITVFGTGRQVRAFTDVRDIVEGLLVVMECDHKGLIFNLGNPSNEITIEKLASRVRELAESRSEIIHVDPKTIFGPLYEDSFDKVPNGARARDILHWQPKTLLDATILDTLAWYARRPEVAQPLAESARLEVAARA